MPASRSEKIPKSNVKKCKLTASHSTHSDRSRLLDEPRLCRIQRRYRCRVRGRDVPVTSRRYPDLFVILKDASVALK